MSVTIELKPETEKRLAEKAAQKGLKIETYIEILAEEDVSEVSAVKEQKHFQDAVTPEEWSAELRRYAENHPKTGVALSDEATRRENIY